jgi:hypothetical protein
MAEQIKYQRGRRESYWLYSAGPGISGKLVWRRYQIIGAIKKKGISL